MNMGHPGSTHSAESSSFERRFSLILALRKQYNLPPDHSLFHSGTAEHGASDSGSGSSGGDEGKYVEADPGNVLQGTAEKARAGHAGRSAYDASATKYATGTDTVGIGYFYLPPDADKPAQLAAVKHYLQHDPIGSQAHLDPFFLFSWAAAVLVSASPGTYGGERMCMCMRMFVCIGTRICHVI